MQVYLRQCILYAMFLAVSPICSAHAEGIGYQLCAPLEIAKQQLHSRGEAVKGRGISPGGTLLQFWQTVDGRDGSITVTMPSQKTCMIAVFKNWEWVIWQLPTPGKDS